MSNQNAWVLGVYCAECFLVGIGLSIVNNLFNIGAVYTITTVLSVVLPVMLFFNKPILNWLEDRIEPDSVAQQPPPEHQEVVVPYGFIRLVQKGTSTCCLTSGTWKLPKKATFVQVSFSTDATLSGQAEYGHVVKSDCMPTGPFAVQLDLSNAGTNFYNEMANPVLTILVLIRNFKKFATANGSFPISLLCTVVRYHLLPTIPTKSSQLKLSRLERAELIGLINRSLEDLRMGAQILQIFMEEYKDCTCDGDISESDYHYSSEEEYSPEQEIEGQIRLGWQNEPATTGAVWVGEPPSEPAENGVSAGSPVSPVQEQQDIRGDSLETSDIPQTSFLDQDIPDQLVSSDDESGEDGSSDREWSDWCPVG